MVVTEEYAQRMRLKKIGSGYQVIGFGHLEAMIGDLYEVLLRAFGKRKVTVNAASGPHLQRATCHPACTTLGAIAYVMHQPVRVMDICLCID